MSIIDDGKIWLRGSARPEYGVRVGKVYFITGKEDAEIINYLIDDNFLYVDIHNSESQYRTIRRFALDLGPKSLGTLFNGFKKTKHADIRAVTYRDKGVEQYRIEGGEYKNKRDDLINIIEMKQLAGWK